MQMKRYKSRRVTNAQERAIYRKFFLTIAASVVILVILVMFGVPILAKLASLINGNSSSTDSGSKKADIVAPSSPSFDYIGNATNSALLDITGNAEPGSTIILTLNGKETEKLTDSNGDFEFADFRILEGKNNIVGYAKDGADNKSNEKSITVLLDTKPPKLEITSPESAEKQITGGEAKTEIKGKTDEITSVKLNNLRTSVDDNGEFTYNYPLKEGDNEIKISVEDQAGNKTEKLIKINYRK